jgi:hypothetical protein
MLTMWQDMMPRRLPQRIRLRASGCDEGVRRWLSEKHFAWMTLNVPMTINDTLKLAEQVRRSLDIAGI